MLSLKIESPDDSLDLGALLNGSEGVQAVAGLTGAGLPPVSVQWSEGAGDGASYRGQRVLPRNIDIPLHIVGDSRASLRATVKRLAMILAAPATLRLTDTGGEQWTLGVVRVGGGDFIYGVDTDGEHELPLVITLRAGQPFWTAVAPVEVVKSTFTTTTITPSNPGSVETPPVWEIRGPGKNLVITSPTGEKLSWNGQLANGETILIDSAKGTVTDLAGASRYANLGPSPRFAKVKPGASANWQVEYPNADPGLSRTNLHTNPNATVDLSGWALFGSLNGGTMAQESGGGIRMKTGTQPSNALAYSINCTPGQTYTISAELLEFASGSISIGWWTTGGNATGTLVGTAASGLINSPTGRLSLTAVAPAGAVVLRLAIGGTPTVQSAGGVVRRCLVEQAASSGTYFDGATPDTATNDHAWTGTAGKSTSTLTLIPDRSTSQVRCRLNPRDWMVV